MIKINTITPPTTDLYAPDGTHLGTLNEYEFIDARVQIKELQESGYYVIHENKKIRIDINGEMEEYPKGFFDSIINSLFKLI